MKQPVGLAKRNTLCANDRCASRYLLQKLWKIAGGKVCRRQQICRQAAAVISLNLSVAIIAAVVGVVAVITGLDCVPE